jgi:hypothetical protein
VAWKTRKKRNYYYRNRRVGKRVVSEYVGGTFGAHCEAQRDQARRGLAEVARRDLEVVKAEQAAIDAQLDELGAQLDELVDATLILAGYHQHKRQWRKKRER